MLRHISILSLGLSLCAGCVVKDTVKDGLRELRPSMKTAELSTAPDGASELNFTFHYELGLVDQAGIAEVRWLYALVDRDRNVLASEQQRMRKPEEDKTGILVQGDRTRRLEVEPGRVEAGATYVLWISVFYRSELLGEHLSPVTEGQPGAPVEDAGAPPSTRPPDGGGLPPTVTEI